MRNTGNQILRTSFPLFSGSFMAQGLNFLLLFLMPVFYSTQDIGHFFVFFALGQIFIPLVSLQSQNSVILSRSYNVAVSNLLISILIGVVLSVLLFLIILPVYLFQIFIPGGWLSWLLFLPIFVLAGSLILSLEQFLTFLGNYKLMGISRFVKAAVVLAFTMGGGWIWPNETTMVIALILGQMGTILFLFLKVRVPFRAVTVSRKIMKLFILRYRDILTYNTLITGLLMCVNHLPTIILSFFFGEKIVAFYGVVQRVFSTLPGVWGHSLAQVFFRKCAGYFNSNIPFSFYVTDTLKKTISLSIPYGIISAILAPVIFSVFMGIEWKEAGEIARVLMPLIVLQSIAIPFTTLFTVLKTQRRIIWFYLGGLVVRIFGGLLLPYLFWGMDYQSGLIIYSLSGVVYYFFYLKELFGQVRRHDNVVKKLQK